MKITISIDERLLNQLEEIARLSNTRLAQECAKLDPKEEQVLAEEGLAAEIDQWPPY